MTDLPLDQGLFGRLRRDAGPAWERYVRHPFVLGLGDGSLPQAAFQHYLKQDYLFLIHFARAYALAAYKSDTLEDLRAAAASVSAIADVEMPLHVTYCAEWGLSEAQMQAEPEDLETMAYTRFVLERGMAGDRLDLDCALIPCVVGYAEVAQRLLADPTTKLQGNPYAAWIRMYAGDEYRALAAGAIAGLDRMGAKRGAEARYGSLLANFTAATRLEEAMWEMGWRHR
jgi:thiaminase/transcriptional activator TenA